MPRDEEFNNVARAALQLWLRSTLPGAFLAYPDADTAHRIYDVSAKYVGEERGWRDAGTRVSFSKEGHWTLTNFEFSEPWDLLARLIEDNLDLLRRHTEDRSAERVHQLLELAIEHGILTEVLDVIDARRQEEIRFLAERVQLAEDGDGPDPSLTALADDEYYDMEHLLNEADLEDL